MTNWNFKQEKENILIDFDVNNLNCSIKNSNLSEYGHAKVDEGLPQINLNHKSGLPLFYELYSGSITDISKNKNKD